jgi:sporulation integral membrane protein YtvI
LLVLVVVFGISICLLINILIRQSIEFIKNIPIYLDAMADRLEEICKHCDKFMGLSDGTMRAMMDDNITQTINKVKSNIMPQLTEHSIGIGIKVIAFFGVFLIIFVAAVLIAKDLPEYQKRLENNALYQDIHKVTEKLSEAGIAYLRCQLIIMSIVAVICFLGLTLIKNDYAVLIGVGIGIMDALPILGSGLILVPWAIITLINGKIFEAAILITTFLVCQIIREVLEPKLIGNQIGIKPIFTLIAIYMGVKLFSFAGFFLGPIGLVIIITIYKVIMEKSESISNPKEIV